MRARANCRAHRAHRAHRARCSLWWFSAGKPEAGRAANLWPREARHAVLRQCVAQHLGVAVDEVLLSHSANGQPLVQVPGALRSVSVSLSGVGDTVAVAVLDVDPGSTAAQEAPLIGIDIEPLAGRPVSAEPLPWLTATEAQAIATAPGAERRRHFLGVWTQKEAYLKALGLGIGNHLPGFEVETDPDAQAALRRPLARAPESPLRLQRLRAQGWVGALATNQRRIDLVEHPLAAWTPPADPEPNPPGRAAAPMPSFAPTYRSLMP